MMESTSSSPYTGAKAKKVVYLIRKQKALLFKKTPHVLDLKVEWHDVK